MSTTRSERDRGIFRLRLLQGYRELLRDGNTHPPFRPGEHTEFRTVRHRRYGSFGHLPTSSDAIQRQDQGRIRMEKYSTYIFTDGCRIGHNL